MKLGVCYYPEQWDRSRWRADARRMAEMGLSLVRIAEFAWDLMEPRAGEFDWAWLDEAIDELAGAGLQVVLGTPTAAPPRWLTEKHPEVLPVDAQGRTKAAGSRRHCCFSSPAYFEASRRIVEAMARRYGPHPAVVAWQTDNEYGCHDTVLSYSPAALGRFRGWLAERYGDIETLNRRWGNVFWSMRCSRFEEVGFPVGLPAQANPVHALDFRRFAADEVLRFNRMQVELLRRHAPGRTVLHNFMGFFGEFDHHAMAQDLDCASWDSYPLGFTDSVAFLSDDERRRWAHSGHPDIAAFHHDLYRNLGGGGARGPIRRFGVMEQQAGPVNWAAWNPVPQPGQVRLWTWEAFAHGAEFVSYFRWRQLPYAQEQMHSGLHAPDDRPEAGAREAATVAAELPQVQAALAGAGGAGPTPVALVFDYASHWMTEIQRHGADFSYFGETFAWYSAARSLGLDVDIVAPGADLAGRALVLVPALLGADAALAGRLAASGAQVLVGARSGSKDGDYRIPDGLAPGPLSALTGVRVRQVESLRPGLTQQMQGEDALGPLRGEVRRWREYLETDVATPAEAPAETPAEAPAEAAAEMAAEMAADRADPVGPVVSARFDDGLPALVQRGPVAYLGACVEPVLLRRLVAAAAQRAGLATQALPQGLRLRRCGGLCFAFHSGPGRVTVPAPAGARFVLGGPELAAAGVAAWHAD